MYHWFIFIGTKHNLKSYFLYIPYLDHRIGSSRSIQVQVSVACKSPFVAYVDENRDRAKRVKADRQTDGVGKQELNGTQEGPNMQTIVRTFSGTQTTKHMHMQQRQAYIYMLYWHDTNTGYMHALAKELNRPGEAINNLTSRVIDRHVDMLVEDKFSIL